METAATPVQPASAPTRLHGHSLRYVRATYFALLLSMVAVFVLAIPARQAELSRLFANLTPSQVLILSELGVSSDQHARLVLAIEVAVPVVYLLIGLLVIRRRSRDWLVLQVSSGMIAYSLWISPPLDSLLASESLLRIPSLIIQMYAMCSVGVFLYIFPDGRFVPGWTRVVVVLSALWSVAWMLMPGSIFDFSNIFNVSLESFLAIMGWLGIGVAAQLYRFFNVASPYQQQQTKVVLFGSAVAVFGYVLFGFDRFAVSVLEGPRHAAVVYDLIGVPIFLVSIIAIPVTFAVSILRYRLWDIDLVINRVLVYAMLTAILGGMYSASITLSQRLFIALTGERSDAAIVITTLVVGATFTYLRGRLQGTVDRYVKPVPHPVKRMQAFGEQVRGFTELIDVDQLARKALHEAVQAFGAGCGAVYLWRDGRYEVVDTQGEWTQVEGMSAWLESDGNRYGWIVLGPRRGGADYSQEDRDVLRDIADLTARTIQLMRLVGIGPGSDRISRVPGVVEEKWG